MSITLLPLEDLSEVERRQASVLESNTLMERAGRDIADRLVRELPEKGSVTILCGTGNNGGDGFTAARCLKARGYRVTCVMVGDEAPHAQEAKAAKKAGVADAVKAVKTTVSKVKKADAKKAAGKAPAKKAPAKKAPAKKAPAKKK